MALVGAFHGATGRDKTCPSRIPALPAVVHEQTAAKTLSDPPGEVTHWTEAMIARPIGINVSSVHRIWRAHGAAAASPAPIQAVARSAVCRKAARHRRPLHRPSGTCAVVLSVDEKSQIQALDRTQPGSPMKKGRCGTMGPMTTSDMARPPCSPRSTWSKARSSAAACNVTAVRRSFAFSIRSKPTFRPTRSSTLSSTITRPTSTPGCGPGSNVTLGLANGYGAGSLEHTGTMPLWRLPTSWRG
jgi:hypothetical protein